MIITLHMYMTTVCLGKNVGTAFHLAIARNVRRRRSLMGGGPPQPRALASVHIRSIAVQKEGIQSRIVGEIGSDGDNACPCFPSSLSIGNTF